MEKKMPSSFEKKWVYILWLYYTMKLDPHLQDVGSECLEIGTHTGAEESGNREMLTVMNSC